MLSQWRVCAIKTYLRAYRVARIETMTSEANTAILVPGARTPFAKAFGELASLSALDLSVHMIRSTLKRTGIKPDDVEAFILGNVLQPTEFPNLARVAGMKAGLPERTPAWTVNMNCASGLLSITTAVETVLSGKAKLVLAGGCEAMSKAQVGMPDSFTKKAYNLTKAAGPGKLAKVLSFRPSDLTPKMPSFKDPISGMVLGQTAEKLAREFKITRDEQDHFALESHKRAMTAQKAGWFNSEITPIKVKVRTLKNDVGPRADATLEKFAELLPVFEKKGTVTAGNSSPMTDGAAGVLVTTETKAKELGLAGVRIVDHHFIGLDPSRMGLGAAYAIGGLAKDHGLSPDDVDLFEVNEAFSAQVLACLRALENEGFCRKRLELKSAFGKIPKERLNPCGGAIALGHPVGASGARLALTAARYLLEHKKDRAVVALCVSGGLGAGMLMERI